ncbi:hypothetical protein LCGC14_0801630 [marine sediment metagenome]|uniref:Uncharacterized protein n=1 Tax=marine sediment metagenome TaxID=412755 RepID=A0A0F9PPA7_9ZZZZ
MLTARKANSISKLIMTVKIPDAEYFVSLAIEYTKNKN